MRKITAILVGGVVLAMLSGCVDEEALMKKANIDQDPDYIKYVQLTTEQKLDEDGKYIIVQRTDPNERQDGKVCVTFAKNNYLETHYYTDAALTKEIDPENCYLLPGESIYAAISAVKNNNSNLYKFAEYRVYTTTSEGERKQVTAQNQDGQLVYTIPLDFAADGIQIVPVGTYETRQFSTNIFYTDRYGKKQEVTTTGTWSVNGSSDMKVSAAESYILRCEYDTTRWFFVSATPKQFTKDPDSMGYVEFYENDPSDAMIEYSVELHPMISVSLTMDQEGTIQVNNEAVQTVKKGKEWTCADLKYGDEITVVTEGKCTIIPSEYQHIKKSSDTINGKTTYKIAVTKAVQKQEDADIVKTYLVNLNVDARYGECTVKLDGKEIKSYQNVEIRENQKLTVTYKITNDAYKFKDETILESVTKTRTATIPVTMSMDGTTINVQRYIDVEKK